MPTPEQILASITRLASDWKAVAIGWHLLVAAALIAVASGWRPTARLAGRLIALLPASAAILALVAGNPFNGVVLAATAGALALLAARAGAVRLQVATGWQRWAGAAVLAFGWVYPHFLRGSPLAYLYAAPVGIAPCPSLSVALGLALLAGDRMPRAWRAVLAAAGAFYGVFGVVRLGVVLDLGLVAGAALVAATTLRHPAPGRHARAALA